MKIDLIKQQYVVRIEAEPVDKYPGDYSYLRGKKGSWFKTNYPEGYYKEGLYSSYKGWVHGYYSPSDVAKEKGLFIKDGMLYYKASIRLHFSDRASKLFLLDEDDYEVSLRKIQDTFPDVNIDINKII